MLKNSVSTINVESGGLSVYMQHHKMLSNMFKCIYPPAVSLRFLLSPGDRMLRHVQMCVLS